jgi:hypothetical protein
MKWDEAADPEDIDDDDKIAFEGLRKVYILISMQICQTKTDSFVSVLGSPNVHGFGSNG